VLASGAMIPSVTDAVISWIHDLHVRDLPPAVERQVSRCLADLVAVAAAGSRTRLAALARDHAYRHLGGADQRGRLYFDGRRTSPVGAAFANAAAIDAMDGHDGHRLTKGHAGAAVLPAVTSLIDEDTADLGDLLAALAVGYEIANRAGMQLHGQAADYHSSGAWNALGAAAVAARLLGLGAEVTEHALGIAEYHAPRAPMMRCIDHPTMVKDSSAQGAHAGVSAALLAQSGFTGAPADLVGAVTDPTWSDLGMRWTILEQYFKPYPVCRWAQPAVHAALRLVSGGDIAAAQISRIDVTTFHQATRLAGRDPSNTEEAQYSLPFPVAAAVVHRSMGEDLIASPSLAGPQVRRLAASLRLQESAEMTEAFPAHRRAEVTLLLTDGRQLCSGVTEAPGDPEDPLSDAELDDKFHRSAGLSLGRERAEQLRAAATSNTSAGIGELLDTIFAPIDHLAGGQLGSSG